MEKRYGDLQTDSYEVPGSMVAVTVGLSLKALLYTGATVNALSLQLIKKYPKLRKYKSSKRKLYKEEQVLVEIKM